METLLVLHNPTDDLLKRSAAWFPELKGAQISYETEALALIEYEEGVHGIAIFVRGKPTESYGDMQKISLSPFAVFVSSPSIIPFLKERIDRLVLYEPYISLQGTKVLKEPWLYADTRLLALSEEPAERTLQKLAILGARYAALTGSGGTTVLEVMGDKTDQSKPLKQETVTYSDANTLLVHANNIEELWHMVTEQETRGGAQTLNSIINKRLLSYFGPGVSFSYDILPLLRNEKTLELSQNGSGSTFFTLHGASSNSVDLARTLALLHTSIRGEIDSTVITQRKLNDRFYAKDIRMEGSQYTSSSTVEDWQIEQTHSPKGILLLASATNGEAFILTNNPQSVSSLTSGPKTPDLPFGDSITLPKVIAVGAVDTDQFPNLLRSITPVVSEGEVDQQHLLPVGSRIVWTLTESDTIRTLHIQE
jgi:hypothetical protein